MSANPELVRNLRAQLRPDRIIAVAAICLVLSVVAGVSQSSPYGVRAPGVRWGRDFLNLVLWAQAVVLVFGGALAALHAIQREKELNTFDYQRVTRLTPLELAAGKLLGAPAFMDFIALCLMPAAIVGAVAAEAHPVFVVAGYAILILGALTVRALALLLSLLVERGVALVAGVLLLLGLWTGPLIAAGATMGLGSVSPFVATQIVTLRSWTLDPTRPITDFTLGARPVLTDVVFGRPANHVLVLAVLYVGFAAWFMLAVARNIKRDPALYQLYTPAQALGLALWMNLIFIAFFRWSRFTPLNAVNAFLAPNAALFFALGLALLRNRDAVRRLAALRAHAVRRVAAMWPAPYIGGGLLAAGLVPVVVTIVGGPSDADWDLGLAVFRVALVTTWILRDLLFLQCMNLQRGGRPLRRGLQYLAVYYVCAGVLLITFHSWTFDTPTGLAASAVFVPPMAMALGAEAWGTRWMLWLIGLVIEAAAVGLFAWLQHARMQELGPAAAPPGAPVAS